RHHGVEHFGRDRARAVAFEIRAAQTLDDVGPDLVADFRLLFYRLRGDRVFDELPQIEIELPLQDRSQHTERCAPQTEGIASTARFLSDREDASERVELVGERERDAGACLGNAVA